MRLVEAKSITSSTGLVLKSFDPGSIPPYAILSHTWGEDEVLYADVVAQTYKAKKAFEKLRNACLQAIIFDLEYIWIDTCCIDKTSSAELTEAINSMYRWYSNARVCFAYIEDYLGERLDRKSFSGSRWFRRSWTLQELLAPRRVIFFTAKCIEIGTKAELSRDLAGFTYINEEILSGVMPIEAASIANRMGWAAHRNATRPEDIAYSLLGIFFVNMPLLYGEGDKAFLRLQEEIMKQTDDQTLFAWIDKDAPDNHQMGLLAPSPACFAETYTLFSYEDSTDRSPHFTTNRGLSIDLPMQQIKNENLYLAALNCPTLRFSGGLFLSIYLEKTSHSLNQFARVRVATFGSLPADKTTGYVEAPSKRIYVRPAPPAAASLFTKDLVFPHHYVRLKQGPPESIYQLVDAFEYTTRWPTRISPLPDRNVPWSRIPRMCVQRDLHQITASFVFVHSGSRKRIMVLIGSLDFGSLGFDAVELADVPTESSGKLESKEASLQQFRPKRLGDVFELIHHRVRIDSSINVQDNIKEYCISLQITPLLTGGGVQEVSASTSTSSSLSKIRRFLS